MDLATIAREWPRVLAALKEASGPRILAYFHGSEPVSLDGDVVGVQFAADFHRTNAVKAQDEFAAATEATLGARLRIGDGADVAVGEGAVSRVTAEPTGGEAEEPLDGAHDDEPLPAGEGGTPPGAGLDSVLDLVTSELGGEVVERREPQ